MQSTNNTYEWQSIGSDIVGEIAFADAGSAVDLNRNGTILSVGFDGYRPEGSSFWDTGLVRVYRLEQDDWVQQGNYILPDRNVINGYGSMGEGR